MSGQVSEEPLKAESAPSKAKSPKPLKIKGLDDEGDVDEPGDEEEAPAGFEPAMADLQSAALGHLATAPEGFFGCIGQAGENLDDRLWVDPNFADWAGQESGMECFPSAQSREIGWIPGLW